MSEIKSIFDFQAQVGLTKHMGSLPATRELVKLCQILPGYRVLDVGCGAGRTPVYLAKEYDFRMVGVDLHPGMVAASRHLAQRARLQRRVSFQVADVQDLPFEDDFFDGVIVESLVAFVPYQHRAVCEIARVLKRGGFAGINEPTYLQADSPDEIIDWVRQEYLCQAEIHTRHGWKYLLENAGLEIMAERLFPLNVRKDTAQTLRRYGVLNLARTWSRAVGMYVAYPEARDVMKLGSAEPPPGLMDYFGYGLFVARKPDG